VVDTYLRVHNPFWRGYDGAHATPPDQRRHRRIGGAARRAVAIGQAGVASASGVMLDLFDTPPLPGLATQEALITAEEEQSLIERIDATGLEPFRFQGWAGKRLTTSFGWNYDFEVGRPREAPPMPDWLIPIRAQAAAFAGLHAEELIQALLIRYDPGAGIGWHRDRPIYGHVLGISLGHAATMRFRRRRDDGFERVSVPLEPRGAYHMDGAARYEWEHSIAPMEKPRWSITFRSLADQR
jgi:alkylated DNA repair dioxygenase AlkB